MTARPFPAAAALHEQVDVAELDGVVQAAPPNATAGPRYAPEEVSQDGAGLANRPSQSESLKEPHGPRNVKSWGPAPPSTIEAYLTRWTHYFATDPCWSSVYQAAHGKSEPDALAHHTFCRRLAAALTPPLLEPCGAPKVKSWGPAPPSTHEEYTASWLQHLVSLFASQTASDSTSQAPAMDQEPVVTPAPTPPQPEAPSASSETAATSSVRRSRRSST